MFTFIETKLFTKLVTEYLSDEKRGGYRAIYFIRRPKDVIWMLTIYPKNLKDSIPGHLLKQIREEIEND